MILAAAIRSKAVVLLLLIHCLFLLQLSVGVLRLVIVLLFSTLCPSSFAVIMIGKRKSSLLNFVLLMSCDCLSSVYFPHGAVGRSARFNCGIR